MGLIIFASRRAHKLAKLQLDFVASVSHELLTPLAAIYCTGQNITDGLVQTKSDSIAHGSIITTQARRLTICKGNSAIRYHTERHESLYLAPAASFRNTSMCSQETLPCWLKELVSMLSSSTGRNVLRHGAICPHFLTACRTNLKRG